MLGIAVPRSGDGGSLADALGRHWPQYAAYAVSFLSIGIIWINHHAMTARLREADHAILMLNLVLLMTVAIIPFATDLLATYLRRPAGHATAAAVYAGAWLLMAIAFSVLNRHILLRKADLLEPALPEAERRRILRQATLGVIPYAIAIPIAFVSPYATLGICGALAVFYATPLGYGTRPLRLSGE